MKKIYLSVLLLALYGCQHGMRTQPPEAASAPVAPSEAAAVPLAAQPVVATAQPVAVSPQPVATTQPETVTPTASPVAQPAATPLPSAAVAEAAAVAKPEVPTEAALSDADGRKLGQKSGCFVCHTVEKKLVGPAWKDIAAKYRGQRDAEARLIAKVAKGGSGAWGTTPMPPNAPRVSEKDIKALVRYILSLK